MTEEWFNGKIYESMFPPERLDPDDERLKITKDILRAKPQGLDLDFIKSLDRLVENGNGLSQKQYNALVKIYYRWNVEGILADMNRFIRYE